MESLTIFEAVANPLGSEIDLSWEYPETSVSRFKPYIFKASSPIENSMIKKYVKDPDIKNVPEGVFVWWELEYPQKTQSDFEILESKTYYYKAVLVNLNDTSDISEIKSIEVKNPKFNIQMMVVPTKKLVIEGIEKLLKALAKVEYAKLVVHNEFPLEQLEGAWIVVTRGSGELAHRFWDNHISGAGGSYTRGNIDADIIQVTWMCSKSPIIRDELTDFFRGTREFLERYCKFKYEGVRDVWISIGADGADRDSYPGRVMPYGTMIMNFLIENQMIIPKSDLRKELEIEFNFTTEGDEALKEADDTPTTHEPIIQ